MKIKQLLCLLATMPLIFSSCKKDDDKDDIDKYVGIYETEIVGLLILPDADFFVPLKDNQNIGVQKLRGNQLMCMGGIFLDDVSVDKEGNFTLPTESGPPVLELADGVSISQMNVKITTTGTITSKNLYITQTWSGSGRLDIYGDKIDTEISTTIAYNGTKKK
jgi:hypothetical protein